MRKDREWEGFGIEEEEGAKRTYVLSFRMTKGEQANFIMQCKKRSMRRSEFFRYMLYRARRGDI